jgi:PAS domain S-box-containing protein
MKGNSQPTTDEAAFVDYKELFEVAPGLFLVLLPNDPIYTITGVSDAYTQAMLTRREEILGRGLFEVFPDNPDDENATGVPNVRASLLRVLETRAPDTMAIQKHDIRRPAEQGGGFEERYWSSVNSPLLNADGSVRLLIHRAEDVTELVRLKRIEAEHGQLAKAERIRADKMEAEVFLRRRELAEIKQLTKNNERVVEALRSSAAEFRQVADSMPQLVWVTRPDGYHEWYNRRWYEYTGTTAEQAEGAGWSDFFHPDDQELAWAKWKRSMETGESYEVEYRCKRHDGVYRWFLGRALPIRDGAGQIVRWFGTCTDIEDQKQAENGRKHSEALLQLVIDKVPGLVAYLDCEARYKFVNRLYCDWFGGQVPLGRKVSEVVGEKAFQVAWPYLQRALAGEEVRFEERLPYEQSKPRHVRVSYSPDRGETGNVLGIVSMVQDVSAEKQMEEALRSSRERLQQVFAEAPVAVCVLRGRELIYELANVSYQALFPKRALQGRPLTEAVPELSNDIITALHRVLDTGVAFAANELLIPIDRTDTGVLEDAWFNIIYHPLRESGEDVTSIVVVAVDVTAQVRARQGLERANRELEEFAYVSSHDLQEPLRMVNIYTQLLVRDLQPHLSEITRRHATVVQKGVSRMEDLLKDLLTFSHNVHADAEVNPASTAALQTSLSQALSTLQDRLDELSAVVTSDSLPVVRGDANQFGHVFQNLIGNALKYRKPNQTAKVHISVRQRGNEWLIGVSDNGIGFEQRHTERIFGLFKRLHKDEYPGTGLGLAICKRIVERYGGRIWAESTLGEGATFFFSLQAAL